MRHFVWVLTSLVATQDLVTDNETLGYEHFCVLVHLDIILFLSILPLIQLGENVQKEQDLSEKWIQNSELWHYYTGYVLTR